MVSEDPETYDIHADLVGGWPRIVTPVLEVTLFYCTVFYLFATDSTDLSMINSILCFTSVICFCLFCISRLFFTLTIKSCTIFHSFYFYFTISILLLIFILLSILIIFHIAYRINIIRPKEISGKFRKKNDT